MHRRERTTTPQPEFARACALTLTYGICSPGGCPLGCIYIYMFAVGVSSRVHMGSPVRARQLRVSSLGFTCNTVCGRSSVRSGARIWRMFAEGGVLLGAYTCSPLEGVLSRVDVGKVGSTSRGYACIYRCIS